MPPRKAQGSMGFKAVIFDMDGTLLDTLDDIAEAANGVLSEMGFPAHPRDAYRTFVGEGMFSLAEQALPEGERSDETISLWVDRVRASFRKRWPAKTKPYDGIPKLLDWLSFRNLKLAIFSNRPDDLTKLMSATMLARWEFSFVHGSGEGNPLKPDPAVALRIAEGLGFKPAECLFLGDSNVDMQAAAAAGMYPVGALWGFRTAEELSSSGARKLIAHPMELIELL